MESQKMMMSSRISSPNSCHHQRLDSVLSLTFSTRDLMILVIQNPLKVFFASHSFNNYF